MDNFLYDENNEINLIITQDQLNSSLREEKSNYLLKFLYIFMGIICFGLVLIMMAALKVF